MTAATPGAPAHPPENHPSEPAWGDSSAGEPIPPLRRDRAVRAWVGASGVSFAGDSVFTIAFAWAAVHEASPAVAGLLVGVGMIPQALLLLVGGALADRLDTRRIVLCANVFRILVLVVGAALWTAAAPRLPLMFAVGILFGIAEAVYQPASATLPRQMVRPDDLGAVSGMFQVARRVAAFAGAALGGWLAAAWGLGVAMLVDAVSFGVVGLVLWAVVRPRFALPRSAAAPVLRGIGDGLAYLRRDRPARSFVVALTGLNLFIGPTLAIGVALQARDLGWGAGAIGAVEATIGVTAALGAAVAIRWRPRHDARAGFVVLLAQAVALAGIGVPSLAVVLAAAGVVGVTAGSASVLLSGAFQRSLDAAYLGRVSSMTTLGDTTLLPVMMPFFGWLAVTTSVATACVTFGAGMLALSAWGATRRELRRLVRPVG